jgi:pyruvate dehydrogenase E2 component (dihydrolipoamide acetyltransferase)
VAREIIMPRLSDSMEEGTILRWLVAEGDQIEAGQPLVEVETDKANVTYEADEAGTVLALSVGEGASVPVGAPIAVIGAAGEELPAAPSSETLAAAAAPAAPAAAPTASAHVATPLAPAPAAAGSASSATPMPAVASSTSSEAPPPTPLRSGRPGRAKASPVARRLAANLGVDLAGLAGSGPNGRVIRADVERAAAGANGGGLATAPAETTEPTSPAAGSAKGETAVHELNRLQRTVARRMAESRATVPDFELRCEVDMTAVVELRERLRKIADPAPSYNDFIVKAVALGLREFPRVNGAYRDGAAETYSRINVGIAVAAEDALVVPTIFDADRMSLGEIGRSARELAAKVRAGSISPPELAGGTFTVSNLGMYGIDSFSAVINPPQAAILAVGSLKPRPVVLDGGELAARPTVNLTLACDHRILYGADGARFLDCVRDLLERPDALAL